MKKRIAILIFFVCHFSFSLLSQEYIADYKVAKEDILRKIPIHYINKARTTLHIAYQHTSHGTHVSRGLFGLQDYKLGDDTLFAITNNNLTHGMLDFRDYALESYADGNDDASDLSRNETAFIQATRNYLDDPDNADVNVVMWSWCDIAEHNINENYLPGMNTLFQEYGISGSKIGIEEGQREQPVTFIFMTGHANVGDNIGEGKPKNQADLINNYCNTNQYYCLDYFSIDAHDMDDNYWEDAGDNGNSLAYDGNFYQDWQDAHTLGEHYFENKESPGGVIEYGEHNTQHITANRKAYAMWWVLARIAGWDGDTATYAEVNTVDSIVISNIVPEVVVGETLQFEVNIYPDTGEQDIRWSVANISGNATISAEGLFTAVDTGAVNVIATIEDGEISDTLSIKITNQPIPIESITVYVEGDFSPITFLDSTLNLVAEVYPEDATIKDVSWDIVNISGEAIIDNNGHLTPLDTGRVIIIANAVDGSEKSDSLDIVIKENPILIESIELKIIDNNSQLYVGDTIFLSTLIQPDNSTYQSLNWSITNPEKVTLNTSGLFILLKDTGFVEIVAMSKDESNVNDTLEIYIEKKNVPVESISIISNYSEYFKEVYPGSTLQFNAVIIPSDASVKEVKWEILNITGNAIINKEGFFTALGTGTVKVIVSSVSDEFIRDTVDVTILEEPILIESISLEIEEKTPPFYVGDTILISPNIYPLNATNQFLDWTISGIRYGSIENSGLFIANDSGNVIIIATSQDGSNVSDSLEINVINKPILIDSIHLSVSNNGSPFVFEDDTIQMEVTVFPQNATNKIFRWRVKNLTGQAVIDENAYLVAMNTGYVNVVAYTTDGSNISDTIRINIIEQPPLPPITANIDYNKTFDNNFRIVAIYMDRRKNITIYQKY